MTSYLGEFRAHWPRLLGACIGLSTGASLSSFTIGLFGPALIADLRWSKADFALLGSLPLLTLLLLPAIGWFSDRAGTRIAAGVGFAGVLLCYVALSLMSGQLWQFFAIYVGISVFGIMTSSMILARAVVDCFDRARGLALSIMMSASPIASAIAAPTLGRVIAEHGWRSGYLMLAAICATGGVVTLALVGRAGSPPPHERAARRLTRADLAMMLRSKVLLVLLTGMFLVNVPQEFGRSQLKLIALDRGVADVDATWMVSLYAIGTTVGRWLCGLALDRVPAHRVGFVAMALPAITYALFAFRLAPGDLLTLSVLLIGFAQGAEADVGAYILSRRFGTKNFSMLYAFLNMTVALGTALGALALSGLLRMGDSYTPFILLCLVTAAAGALFFGLTGVVGRRETPLDPRPE